MEKEIRLRILVFKTGSQNVCARREDFGYVRLVIIRCTSAEQDASRYAQNSKSNQDALAVFLKSWLGTFQQRPCESCTEHHARLLAMQGSGSAWVTCQCLLCGCTTLQRWEALSPPVSDDRKRKRLANAPGMRFRLKLLLKREKPTTLWRWNKMQS